MRLLCDCCVDVLQARHPKPTHPNPTHTHLTSNSQFPSLLPSASIISPSQPRSSPSPLLTLSAPHPPCSSSACTSPFSHSSPPTPHAPHGDSNVLPQGEGSAEAIARAHSICMQLQAPLTAGHRSSVISHQPSVTVISHQSSATSHQPPVISQQSPEPAAGFIDGSLDPPLVREDWHVEVAG